MTKKLLLGSTALVGAIAIALIKKIGPYTIEGDPMKLDPKDKGVTRYLIGGTIFGLGWAMTGACPGPMFTLIGHGVWSILLVIGSAMLGTYTYGLLRAKLPH